LNKGWNARSVVLFMVSEASSESSCS